MTFDDWLQGFMHDDSPLGDLARDYYSSPCCWQFGKSPTDLSEHLEHAHRASPMVLDVLWDSITQYVKSTN